MLFVYKTNYYLLFHLPNPFLTLSFLKIFQSHWTTVTPSFSLYLLRFLPQHSSLNQIPLLVNQTMPMPPKFDHFLLTEKSFIKIGCSFWIIPLIKLYLSLSRNPCEFFKVFSIELYLYFRHHDFFLHFSMGLSQFFYLMMLVIEYLLHSLLFHVIFPKISIQLRYKHLKLIYLMGKIIFPIIPPCKCDMLVLSLKP